MKKLTRVKKDQPDQDGSFKLLLFQMAKLNCVFIKTRRLCLGPGVQAYYQE